MAKSRIGSLASQVKKQERLQAKLAKKLETKKAVGNLQTQLKNAKNKTQTLRKNLSK